MSSFKETEEMGGGKDRSAKRYLDELGSEESYTRREAAVGKTNALPRG